MWGSLDCFGSFSQRSTQTRYDPMRSCDPDGDAWRCSRGGSAAAIAHTEV